MKNKKLKKNIVKTFNPHQDISFYFWKYVFFLRMISYHFNFQLQLYPLYPLYYLYLPFIFISLQAFLSLKAVLVHGWQQQQQKMRSIHRLQVLSFPNK